MLVFNLADENSEQCCSDPISPWIISNHAYVLKHLRIRSETVTNKWLVIRTYNSYLNDSCHFMFELLWNNCGWWRKLKDVIIILPTLVQYCPFWWIEWSVFVMHCYNYGWYVFFLVPRRLLALLKRNLMFHFVSFLNHLLFHPFSLRDLF